MTEAHSSNPVNSGPKELSWTTIGCKQHSSSEWGLTEPENSQAVLRESPNDHNRSWADIPKSSRLHPSPTEKPQRHLKWEFHWIQGELFHKYVSCTDSFCPCACECECVIANVPLALFCIPHYFTLVVSQACKWVTTVVKYILYESFAKLFSSSYHLSTVKCCWAFSHKLLFTSKLSLAQCSTLNPVTQQRGLLYSFLSLPFPILFSSLLTLPAST